MPRIHSPGSSDVGADFGAAEACGFDGAAAASAAAAGAASLRSSAHALAKRARTASGSSRHLNSVSFTLEPSMKGWISRSSNTSSEPAQRWKSDVVFKPRAFK